MNLDMNTVRALFNGLINSQFRNLSEKEFDVFGEAATAKLMGEPTDAPSIEFDDDEEWSVWLMSTFDPDRIYRESE